MICCSHSQSGELAKFKEGATELHTNWEVQPEHTESMLLTGVPSVDDLSYL
jgi:hypothetical protein